MKVFKLVEHVAPPLNKLHGVFGFPLKYWGVHL